MGGVDEMKVDQRQALATLNKAQLRDLADFFDLAPPSALLKDDLIDLLARSKRASFEKILGELMLKELKAICLAAGLDDSGRSKAPIVDRILGREPEPASEPQQLEIAPGPAPPEKPKKAKKRGKKKDSGAVLGFEEKMWTAADKLRNNMDAAEYKHVVLGLIFLKYISDAFEEKHAELLAEGEEYAEDRDEYMADRIFWVPREARWPHLEAQAKTADIGKSIDAAMEAIERDNHQLKGVLPKEYGRPSLDKQRLGELVDLVSTIGLGDKENRSRAVLGRVYEYFLSEFASAEGKKGGQFYTPQCVVQVLAPYRGRVFDPCCGSGGMFVQSEKFVEAHGGVIGDISIYRQ